MGRGLGFTLEESTVPVDSNILKSIRELKTGNRLKLDLETIELQECSCLRASSSYGHELVSLFCDYDCDWLVIDSPHSNGNLLEYALAADKIFPMGQFPENLLYSDGYVRDLETGLIVGKVTKLTILS